ncbi:ABC transporter permease [Nocardia sp. IFM 10818]
MSAAFAKLLEIQTKRTLREPAAAFFMVAFGPLFVVLMGTVFGNAPAAEFDGRGYLDANLVGFSAIVIAIVSLILVPVDIVSQRENGSLRRFRATPLRPLTYIAADVLVRFTVCLFSIGAMIGIGVLVFGARPHGNPLAVLAAVALGVLAFLAVGYALAALLPSQAVAQTIGNVLVYPLIFLSGAAVPLAVLPDGVRRAAEFSPLTQLVTWLQGLWSNGAWSDGRLPLALLLGILAGATAVATRWFRWE